MRCALVAINESGGEAIALGGGSWRGADGALLTYDPPDPNSLQRNVSTSTIYALQDRGLLERYDTEKPQRYWLAPRRVTPRAGEILVGDGED